MTRAKHERSIRRAMSRECLLNREPFETAIDEIIKANGLAWFTDAQIEEIREVMTKADWTRSRRWAAICAPYADIIERTEG